VLAYQVCANECLRVKNSCNDRFCTFAQNVNMSSDDLAFLEYWEQNRRREKKLLTQVAVGLPLGLVFGLPILLSFLLRGWYKRMPYISGSQFTVIVMALLGIAVFYGIFRMKFKWEINEQRYRELLALKKKETESNGSKIE
jgi:hypothetical protein